MLWLNSSFLFVDNDSYFANKMLKQIENTKCSFIILLLALDTSKMLNHSIYIAEMTKC
jgi:hypothetical protein